MGNHLRRAAAGALAALLMGLAVAGASASNFSATNRTFRVVWSALQMTDNNGNPAVECPVTLEGSFHSQTFAKTIRALVGYISRAVLAATEPPCSGGTGTILTSSLPWHLTYEAFSGRLPNITSIRFKVRGVAYSVVVFGVRCLYAEQGEPEEVATGEAVINLSNQLITENPDATIRIRKSSGGILCPARVGWLGTSNPITSLGSSTKVTITLI